MTTTEPWVWVLVVADGRQRANSHAPDCARLRSLWRNGDGYQKVPVSKVHQHIGRCQSCGGGRPPGPETADGMFAQALAAIACEDSARATDPPTPHPLRIHR